MDSGSDSEDCFTCTPQILEVAQPSSLQSLSKKSRDIYEKEYETFKTWCRQNGFENASEIGLLSYFAENAKNMKSSSLWSKYSMLKTTLSVKDNADIKYPKLLAFLKRQAVGYRPKKSSTFTREHLNEFLLKAPDDFYLMAKVCIIMGIAGACVGYELTNMKIEDIQEYESVLLCTIPDSETRKQRVFVVNNFIYGDESNLIGIYKKYVSLRSPKTEHRRLFVNYKDGKCTVQPVGKNTINKIPSMIAKYLRLPNPEDYTGHCFRRTSVNLLGGNTVSLKRNREWQSTLNTSEFVSVATPYKEEILTTERNEYSNSKQPKISEAENRENNESWQSTTVAEEYMDDSYQEDVKPIIMDNRNMFSDPTILQMSNGNDRSSIKECNFNFSTSNFDTIVNLNSFVDKSLLIKTIFQHSPMILITAPRRFGKSTNMDMLKKFVEIQVNEESGEVIQREYSSNYHIFSDNNLLIYQDQDFFIDYFAGYPVIHTSFKGVNGSSFDTMLDSFRYVLHKTFAQHPYLLKSEQLDTQARQGFADYYGYKSHKNLTENDIHNGLEFLSECLYKHFNKKQVFVLIDEYDVPINNTMFENDIDINRVNNLLCQIFSNTFKENRYVERALLTGTSYFASVGLPNNIEKYMFLSNHSFVPFYGLTELEVDSLLSKFDINDETKEQVKSHYDGYISLNNIKLFSPWSILHYLNTKRILNYWEQSGTILNLENTLHFPVVRYAIEKLCLMDSLEIKILEKIKLKDVIKLKQICLQDNSDGNQLNVPDVYLFYLLQQGYLSYANVIDPFKSRYLIKIPNFEIKTEFEEKITEFYEPSINASLKACAVSLNKLTTNMEDEILNELKIRFESLLNKLNFKIMNEDTCQCFMFNVLCKTNFSIGSELSFTRGRPDLILYKDNAAVIIEVKYKQSSEVALKQIVNQCYNVLSEKSYFNNVKDNIFIGINVDENNTVSVGKLVNCVTLNEAKYL